MFLACFEHLPTHAMPPLHPNTCTCSDACDDSLWSTNVHRFGMHTFAFACLQCNQNSSHASDASKHLQMLGCMRCFVHTTAHACHTCENLVAAHS